MENKREERIQQITSRLPDLTDRQLGLVLAAIQGMRAKS